MNIEKQGITYGCMTNKTILISTLILFLTFSVSGQQIKFACPLAGGKMIKRNIDSIVNGDPIRDIIIIAKNDMVYASAIGVVLVVEDKDRPYNLAVQYGHYIFMYSNLTSINVHIDQKLKKGALLGMTHEKQITLSILKNTFTVDHPEKLLNCKSQ